MPHADVTADVTADGIVLPSASGVGDEALDVAFDDSRVWSFHPGRDGVRTGDTVAIAWPAPLRPHLHGAAEVSITGHVSGVEVFRAERAFGTDTRRLVVADARGRALVVDKSGRYLSPTFEDADAGIRRAIAEATRRVADDLRDRCGMQPYLVYGGLLGAARGGHLIGHDTDTDLAVLTRAEHPFDIVREIRAAELKMRDLGWKVTRMSAADFKVKVPVEGISPVGVDVFGSFHIDGRFHLMGNLSGDLAPSSILPFGEIELEGVPLPAPADVDAFLTFTYGPTWRVPDPAWRFQHPRSTIARMGGWWRGSRHNQWRWQAQYGAPQPTDPSPFARWVASRLTRPTLVVDVGSGNGHDAAHLAAEGHRVQAYDYLERAHGRAKALAHKKGVEIELVEVALGSPRDVLLRGAQLAHTAGPRVIYCRDVVDTLIPEARDGVWRLCALALRREGTLFLEYDPAAREREPWREAVTAELLTSEIEASGGTTLSVEKTDGAIRLTARWTP